MTLFQLMKSLQPFLRAKIYDDEVIVRINGRFYTVTDTGGAVRANKGVIIIDAEAE